MCWWPVRSQSQSGRCTRSWKVRSCKESITNFHRMEERFATFLSPAVKIARTPFAHGKFARPIAQGIPAVRPEVIRTAHAPGCRHNRIPSGLRAAIPTADSVLAVANRLAQGSTAAIHADHLVRLLLPANSPTLVTAHQKPFVVGGRRAPACRAGRCLATAQPVLETRKNHSIAPLTTLRSPQ